MEHWRRRGAELNRMQKADLCAMYRRLGGLGGIHPPESWRKDEVISSITDMEWHGLPDDQKLPDPPRLQPPCDECGTGPDATAHKYGGTHNYRYSASDKPWVPVSEAEAERIAREFPATEEQPAPPATATVSPTGWTAPHPISAAEITREVLDTLGDSQADFDVPAIVVQIRRDHVGSHVGDLDPAVYWPIIYQHDTNREATYAPFAAHADAMPGGHLIKVFETPHLPDDQPISTFRMPAVAWDPEDVDRELTERGWEPAPEWGWFEAYHGKHVRGLNGNGPGVAQPQDRTDG